MTILYISASRIPSRAANSIHVMKMCNAFATNGHQVHLTTAKVTSDLEVGISDYFSFYGIKKSFVLYRLPWLEVRNFAFFYALEILFIFFFLTIKNKFTRPLCYGRFVLGCYLVSFFAKEVILEMHATVGKQYSEQYMFKKITQKKNFKYLVVISDSLAQEISKIYPYLKNKIKVAHDGADIVPLEEKIILSNDLEITHLGYVGHLYQGRGVETMISIVRNNPKLHLHLVGGTENDIAFWKEYIINIPNITVYGFLPPSETIKFRNSVDILLAPYERKVSVYGSSLDTSRWMSPLKIFEYMSAKKPIICSDIPVLKEVLTHEKNALLCDPDLIDEWRLSVSRIINDKNFAKKLSEQAYGDFINRYTWENRAKIVL